MLKVYYGRAGTGKTGLLLDHVKKMVDKQCSGQIILVPDQYSHDMERALCAYCGDHVSLYAEVLSLTRLGNRLFSQEGGLAHNRLEEGGRLLVMEQALTQVESQLHFFHRRGQRPDFLRDLVSAYDESRCCLITPEALRAAAQLADPFTADKLLDLSLLFECYDALTAQLRDDPRQMLDQLTALAGSGEFVAGRSFYIDGFNGFTPQEQSFVETLIGRAKATEIFFTCDTEQESGEDCFARSRRTMKSLLRYAKRHNIAAQGIQITGQGANREPALAHLEHELMNYQPEPYRGDCSALRIQIADTPLDECEMAAAEILRLVQEEGLRYRDITVAARDFSGYESLLRGTFHQYGIPLYEDETSDLLEKPILTLVLSAMDAVEERYEYDALFRYLKTGLTGLSQEEVDRLENYVLIWNLHGRHWKQDWTRDPRGLGFTKELPEPVMEQLRWLNQQRKKVIEPLERFRRETGGERSARELMAALFALLDRLQVPRQIQLREQTLRDHGALQQAEEYRQLWEILVQAMDQFVLILEETPMNLTRFSELFRLVLSQYRVGSIPVSIDRVSAGGAERMRRRGMKALIVLGATEDLMPMLQRDGGLFSEADREFLSDQGLELGVWGSRRIEQEMELIYSLFTLPRNYLMVSYPRFRAEETRPSFVIQRILQIFPAVKVLRQSDWAGRQYLCARQPCLGLAVASPSPRPKEWENQQAAKAALDGDPELKRLGRERLAARGPLSREAVQRLFGSRMRMSASRMDRYRSCKFSYFLQYGLHLRPRRQVKFDAPAVGTFLHYILEHTIRQIQSEGGVQAVPASRVEQMIQRFIQQYLLEQLGGLEDKTARFRYLFQRLCATVARLVASVLDELRCGSFVPLDYELRFAEHGDLPPVTVSAGEGTIELSGIVDRVDGYRTGDKLYYRIMDYKSGQKTFDLTDVWHGLGIQTLLYLFALQETGPQRYGQEIDPAGVLYVPIRDPILHSGRHCRQEELQRQYHDELRRSGLLLENAAVLDAMEHGVNGKAEFLPLSKGKSGDYRDSASLATREQFEKLRRHVKRLLAQLASELSSGKIEADPYIRGNSRSACDYCEYALVCQFDETAGCDRKRYLYRVEKDEFWQRMEEK